MTDKRFLYLLFSVMAMSAGPGFSQGPGSVFGDEAQQEKNLEARSLANSRLDTIDYNKPLFVNGNGPYGAEVKWQSLVTTYSPVMMGGSYLRGTEKRSCFEMTNGRGVDIFRIVFAGKLVGHSFNYWQNCRLELRMRDTTRVTHAVDDEIQYDNYFGHFIWANKFVPDERLKELVYDDARRYHGIDYHWEKQRKRCLVFKLLDSTKYGLPDGKPLARGTREHAEWRNVTIDEVIKHLIESGNYHKSRYPLINDTGFSGRIGRIMVRCDMRNHEALDRELQKYGLRLVLEERDVDVLVVTDAL